MKLNRESIEKQLPDLLSEMEQLEQKQQELRRLQMDEIMRRGSGQLPEINLRRLFDEVDRVEKELQLVRVKYAKAMRKLEQLNVKANDDRHLMTKDEAWMIVFGLLHRYGAKLRANAAQDQDNKRMDQ